MRKRERERERKRERERECVCLCEGERGRERSNRTKGALFLFAVVVVENVIPLSRTWSPVPAFAVRSFSPTPSLSGIFLRQWLVSATWGILVWESLKIHTKSRILLLGCQRNFSKPSPGVLLVPVVFCPRSPIFFSHASMKPLLTGQPTATSPQHPQDLPPRDVDSRDELLCGSVSLPLLLLCS